MLTTRDPSDSRLLPYRAHFVPLASNLTAAVFPLMKIYPAAHCVRNAIRLGHAWSDSLIVESSSGSMALALAIVGRLCGCRVTIVTDYAVDEMLRRRLEDLGTTVERVTAPASVGGYQRARLDRLGEIRRATPNHWWLNQYGNPDGATAYESFAAEVIQAVGRVDCLVGTVGTGGSMCGTAAYLRTVCPDLPVVGVDTFNSVLFGQPDGPRRLRGLGNSILPPNVDHTAFDEIHWLTAAEAFRATRELYRQTTIFAGGTSGAAWLVARHWAASHPRARTLCLFPDDGYRYVDDIYNDDYLIAHGLWQGDVPQEPEAIAEPWRVNDRWSSFAWGRRRYRDVVKTPLACSA